jgi:hypothetical protein
MTDFDKDSYIGELNGESMKKWLNIVYYTRKLMNGEDVKEDFIQAVSDYYHAENKARIAEVHYAS